MDFKVYSAKDFPNYLPKLNNLYDDLFSGGKGFRAKLTGMVCAQLSVPDSTVKLLAQTIEFIHNASLLHDDLVDRSSLRRGKPAAWLKYTPEFAVLAGDYLLARVMVNLSSYGRIELVHYTAEMISDLLEGEWLQDSLIGDMNVELGQLDRVHNLKTASLFKWCLRAPFIALGRNEAGLHSTLEEMGTILGQLFQRSDDLLDFNIRNHEGKGVLTDLKSGYLNSFAAFAVDKGARNGLRNCQSLEEFIIQVGGAEKYQAQVNRFDETNKRLIALYQHGLENLSHYLQESEKGLLSDLAPLTEILYWRKSKG